MPRASQLLARAPTFGVLVDWLEDEYQSTVVGGMVEAARESGVNLVCFVGAELHAPSRFGERRNVVYDLARSEGIDALVILAGSLGNHLGLDDLARYCERYRPLPMSSIADELEGMTSILIDGEQALREGIRHLVEGHQYRRIAFLGGPESNLDARVRLRTYGEVLTTYGLRPPDSFVGSWRLAQARLRQQGLVEIHDGARGPPARDVRLHRPPVSLITKRTT